MITIEQLSARRAELSKARQEADTAPEVSIIEAKLEEINFLINLNFNTKATPFNCIKKNQKLELELELIGIKPSDYGAILLESDYSIKKEYNGK